MAFSHTAIFRLIDILVVLQLGSETAKTEKMPSLFDNVNRGGSFPFANSLLTILVVSDIETYDLRTR